MVLAGISQRHQQSVPSIELEVEPCNGVVQQGDFGDLYIRKRRDKAYVPEAERKGENIYRLVVIGIDLYVAASVTPLALALAIRALMNLSFVTVAGRNIRCLRRELQFRQWREFGGLIPGKLGRVYLGFIPLGYAGDARYANANASIRGKGKLIAAKWMMKIWASIFFPAEWLKVDH